MSCTCNEVIAVEYNAEVNHLGLLVECTLEV